MEFRQKLKIVHIRVFKLQHRIADGFPDLILHQILNLGRDIFRNFGFDFLYPSDHDCRHICLTLKLIYHLQTAQTLARELSYVFLKTFGFDFIRSLQIFEVCFNRFELTPDGLVKRPRNRGRNFVSELRFGLA